MKSALSQILGGIGVIAAATLLGIVVNSVRPGGIPLIQKGKPVSTTLPVATDSTSTDSTSTDSTSAGVVTLKQMKQIFDEGKAFIIDARDPGEFNEGHIPRAINVPYDKLPEYLDMLSAEVPTNAQVVVYCRGPGCDFSDQLATELKILGYENVSVFKGGWDQWTAADYPIDGKVPK